MESDSTDLNKSYDFKLSFNTEDQSIWSSGDAFIFDFKKQFLTPSFSTDSIKIDPGPVKTSGITVDPRFAFSAEGQMGVEAGFLLNSGSVDANIDYDVNFQAPASLNAGEFFKLHGSVAASNSSAFVTTSPTLETYLDGIIRFRINDFYEAKVSGGSIFNGIKNGTFVHQRDQGHGGSRVELDIQEELYGFNKDGLGRLVLAGKDQGGVGDEISIGEPDPLAKFKIGDWRIDATGKLSGSSVSALGSTELLANTLDIDQLLAGKAAPLFGLGATFKLGPNIDLSVAYDILDYEVISSIGYQQNFDINSTVSVVLSFSENVLVKDANGNQLERDTIFVDDMANLPEIALIGQSVEVTPEFIIDADLHNQTDINFDAIFEFKVIAAKLDLDFHSTFVNRDIYSKSLGPLRTFEHNLLSEKIPVYNEEFDLGGFERITGEKFILSVNQQDSVDNPGGHNNDSGIIHVRETSLADIISFHVDSQTDTVLFTLNSGEQVFENAKRIHFSDAVVAFDTAAPSNENPGENVWQAAALYHAGFGAMADIKMLSQWVVEADQINNMAELAMKMINHYAPGISSDKFVTHVYKVLTNEIPTKETVQFYVDQIGEDRPYKNQGEIFAYAASLPINAEIVTELVGDAQQLDITFF